MITKDLVMKKLMELYEIEADIERHLSVDILKENHQTRMDAILYAMRLVDGEEDGKIQEDE